MCILLGAVQAILRLRKRYAKSVNVVEVSKVAVAPCIGHASRLALVKSGSSTGHRYGTRYQGLRQGGYAIRRLNCRNGVSTQVRCIRQGAAGTRSEEGALADISVVYKATAPGASAVAALRAVSLTGCDE